MDLIIAGGFPRDQVYLVQGEPGVGKTTLALQFLLEGIRNGDRGLYVTLSETSEEIRAVARSHGWSTDGVEFCELSTAQMSFKLDAQNTVFHASEMELADTMNAILAEIERVKPVRLVFDSLSELRLLSQHGLHYRRQILALKTALSGRRCTVLLVDDLSAGKDQQLQSLAHGVVTLEFFAPGYGGDRRRLRVNKLRSVNFRSGWHDFKIETGGLTVFPRLVAAEHHREFRSDRLTSGIVGLDSLLSGGIDRGTSTLLMGPAGSGKSSIATQYVCAAAEHGERGAIFVFDESVHSLCARSAGLGLALAEHMKSGRVKVQKVDPAELSPGEFIHVVREQVERHDVTMLAIDSLNGYLNAMPDERFLTIVMHELLSYLGRRGVTTLLVMAHSGVVGQMRTPVDVSYLADNVLLLRFFESKGSVRKAISAVKKRSGAHEETIRELRLSANGIRVGEALVDFHGVLTGGLNFHGDAAALLRRE